MEIVSIERQVFERMVAKFEAYVRRVDEICRDNDEKRMGGWLDNQDVCWHTAKSATRRITVPKTWNASCLWWRTGARMPCTVARAFEKFQYVKPLNPKPV